MSTSNTRGGGFLVGVIYGLIVSIALFLVLCFLFPVQIEPAPMGAQTASAETAPAVLEAVAAGTQAPTAGAQPVAPEITVPVMMQPDTGTNDTISVGGAGDSGPAQLANTQIAGNEAVSEPVIATEPAGVPDIGNGTRETSVPGAGSAAPTAPAEAAASAPVAAPSELVETASGPAIEVFATAFTGDMSKPLLAIVLEDTLEGSLQPLLDSGMPITFAVPAGVESRIAAQSIRGAGFEVVALIPDGTSRTDGLAENVGRFMKNVPVAVAMLDSGSPSLMLNRDSMQVVLEATGKTGLGLISLSKNGELVARAQAEQMGVPFGSALQITDDFQDEELIIQALNQAAFVAGTNDRAIIFAKTHPSTINALLRWFNSARASQVEIVPVSVVLQRPAN